MKKLVIYTFIAVLFGCLCAALCFAAFEDKNPGARPAGLGNAYVALADDCSALQYNPAGLAFLDTMQAGFAHTELFSLDDLKYDWAAVALPVYKGIGFGVAYSQFGPDIYREIETTVGCGYALSHNASFGVSVKRLDLRIKEYGSAYDWAGSVGFLGKISDMVWIGMAAKNVYATHLGKTNEMPEKSVLFGGRIIPRDFLTTVVEAGREIDADRITYRLGQEVTLFDIFIIRFGFHNYPDRLSGGFGFLLQNIRLDYAVITHQYLDIQHQFSILVRW